MISTCETKCWIKLENNSSISRVYLPPARHFCGRRDSGCRWILPPIADLSLSLYICTRCRTFPCNRTFDLLFIDGQWGSVHKNNGHTCPVRESTHISLPGWCHGLFWHSEPRTVIGSLKLWKCTGNLVRVRLIIIGFKYELNTFKETFPLKSINKHYPPTPGYLWSGIKINI